MTMVLVVYAHVMRFSLDMRDMVSMFFTIFRMPTFFFISDPVPSTRCSQST